MIKCMNNTDIILDNQFDNIICMLSRDRLLKGIGGLFGFIYFQISPPLTDATACRLAIYLTARVREVCFRSVRFTFLSMVA